MLVHEDLYYTESHEWVRIQDDLATVGLTDFAQSELGEIVYIELPEMGMKVSADVSCGSIEAVKSAEDIVSPLSGKIEERNSALDDSLEIINKSPYDDGWLFKIRLSAPEEVEKLLSAQDYRDLISS